MDGIIGVGDLGGRVVNSDESGERQASCWNPVYYPTVRVLRLAGGKV